MAVEAERISLRARFEAYAAQAFTVMKDFTKDQADDLFKIAVCVAGGRAPTPPSLSVPFTLEMQARQFVKQAESDDEIAIEAFQSFMRELCDSL